MLPSLLWRGFVSVAALGIAALLPAPAHAADCSPPEGRLLTAAAAGPYTIAVTVLPEDTMVGSVRITTVVCDTDGVPVPDAAVTLTPTSPQDVTGRPALALNRGGRAEEYTADLSVKAAGEWRYRVDVASPRGPGSTEVSVAVRLPKQTGDSAAGLVFFGVFGALVLGGGYVALEARRAGRANRR